ncbi:hypothetical protein SAMN05444851_1769 [Aliiroseovarius sediminilitoris]|uniref:Uncharacterized protein n=1 Tax=Aliiroseovarius sediminilitoris TaxID=1173584 RepID=A0A1I0PNR7_9RHOB|nr:hypothetical protein SAMN05444851_1769 [Aliiroseovarius sediminilitoris]
MFGAGKAGLPVALPMDPMHKGHILVRRVERLLEGFLFAAANQTSFGMATCDECR